MDKIRIQCGDIQLVATLRDTSNARAILAALPVRAVVQTWGDEVYFSVPVSATLESDARDIVEPGELAFRVEGCCIAIGFGPTPKCRGTEIRLAAKTNLCANTHNDVTQLYVIEPGESIVVERLGADQAASTGR
ncbi:MAG: cyclophilin-like fold protein [Acidiferrobacterales bacterium]